MITVKLPDGHTYTVAPNTMITGKDGNDYLVGPNGEVTKITGVDAPVIIAGPYGPTVAAGTAVAGAVKSAAGPVAGAVAGTALKDLGIVAVVAFLFSSAGGFIKNFTTTLLKGLGEVNQAYIIGLLVAAVVVFILLGG